MTPIERSILENQRKLEQAQRQQEESRQISEDIRKAMTTKDLLACKHSIQSFMETNQLSDDNMLVLQLQSNLRNQYNTLIKTIDSASVKIKERIELIEKQQVHESADVLTDLNTQANVKLMELLMKFRKNDEGYNKRFIGSVVATADRVTAIALEQLSLIPAYSDLITTKQREKLATLVLSKEQADFEAKKQQELSKLKSALGKTYSHGFLLRQAESRLFK